MEFDLSRLMQEMGNAVSEAQQNLENHSLQRFLSYFEPVSEHNQEQDSQKSMKPRTMQMIMPSDANLNKTIVAEIPLVTLANHMAVNLKQISIKVRANLSMDESGAVKATVREAAAVPTDSMDAPAGKSAESDSIEMVFQVAEQPEGAARITQNIERLL